MSGSLDLGYGFAHHREPPGHRDLLPGRVRGPAGRHPHDPLRPADARGHPEPAHGRRHGHPHQLGRRDDLRPGLGHRRHRRRGAVADRQCQPQSRPELHHRQLHGRGVRRRRQSLGHLHRRLHAGHRQQAARAHRRARCWPRSWSWSRSSCSSRSGRAGCSPSRAGPWRAEPMLKAFPAATWIVVPLLLAVAVLVPVLNLDTDPASAWHVPTYMVSLTRQVSVLRDPGAERRSGLGLLRHPEPRPRRLLRARRLRHGHVPDAPDRRRAASTPTRTCRTSWCS